MYKLSLKKKKKIVILAGLGLVGSIRTVNQLMTIIEQGHPGEARGRMRMIVAEKNREQDKLRRLENNDGNPKDEQATHVDIIH